MALKRILVLGIFSLLVLLIGTPSQSASPTGTSCKKQGLVKVVGSKKYTCIKSGKKLLWNKGVSVKVAAPVASPTPTPNISQPQPSQSSLPQLPTLGSICDRVGNIFTVSGRDLVCSSDGAGRLTWQWRVDQPGNNNQPGVQPSPQPQQSGVQPSPQPQQPGVQPSPQPTATSKSVKEVLSTYSSLESRSGTSITSSAKPSGYLAATGYASTSGSTLFDHPSGLASDGNNLVLVDRGNNRILVWKSAPTSPTIDPDFVLCQPNTTSTASGSSLSQCNWPSDAVITSTGKLLVADSDNNRILVWSSMPTSTGASASYAIDLGADAWPWGIWSDGTRVVASMTGKSRLSFWNTFPTTGNEAPSFSIDGSAATCIGTPRGLVSNGTVLMTGDHNGKCGEEKGIHVYTTFPTSSSAKPSYMIVPPDANYAWPMGSFDRNSGKAYLLSRTLQEFTSFPATKPNGTQIASNSEFEGGDGGDVEIVNGYMYVTEYNGNRVSVFKGIPSATASPDFYLGLTSTTITKPVENTLKSNYLITNPQVATLDGAMAINSDFDRAIYVWKKIPATSGAKPDLVWTTQNQNDSNPLLAMDFQPDSSDTGKLDGKSIYAVAGEKTFVVWEGIPTSTNSVPILNIKDSIGNVNFDMHLRVAVDDKYFYLLDGGAKKIYVWLGLPAGKTDNPDFTLSADANRIRSDGKYLIATSLYNSPHTLVWNVSTLKSGAEPVGKVAYSMNLPQDALAIGDALFVADTSFHRVLFWRSISAAMGGSAPDAFIGTGSSASDIRPGQSETELRWPASLWVENGYLWVGERKFGHRIFRYDLS